MTLTEERVVKGGAHVSRAFLGGGVQSLELGLERGAAGLLGRGGAFGRELDLEGFDGTHEGLVVGAGFEHLGGDGMAVIVPVVLVRKDNAAGVPDLDPGGVVGHLEEVAQIATLDAFGVLTLGLA